MIQSYDQIKQQANNINSELSDVVFIQKIYSSAQFVSLSIRYNAKTEYIYLGRGSGFEGVWKSSERVAAPLRQIDKFLEYIRKHLGSSSLRRLDTDDKDRILRIKYFKWGRDNYFYLFYKARKLYFANTYFDQKSELNYVFKSWTNKKTIFDNESYEMFDEVGRIELEDQNRSDQVISRIETLLAKEYKKANLKSAEGKSKKFLKRKLKNIQQDLIQVRNWPKLNELIDQTEDMTRLERKIEVSGIKLTLKTKEHFHRRDEVYLKIKKFKKAIGILELRERDTIKKLDTFGESQILKSQLPVISPAWSIKKEQIKEKSDQPQDYKVFTFNDFSIAIGNTAKGNDQMRRDWAKKEDLWFHLDGDKSPHIILKDNNGTLEQEKLQIIAGVMIKYSKETYTIANLIYTQVKNLKGVKGVPGSVIHKKAKRIQIVCSTNWEDSLI
jgi:predicted ribosome quality control (RQC) complex YloA/Tae2 family protein